jgi:hypothetical protein
LFLFNFKIHFFSLNLKYRLKNDDVANGGWREYVTACDVANQDDV